MEVKKPQEEVLTYAEVIAQFPGGENNMMQWLSDHINYPTEAAQKGIEGIVVTRFIIDATGNIKDPEVFRSSGNDLLDKEALRVVSLMPDWIPSEHKGKKVAMYYMLPIRFKMPNRLPAEFVNPTK
ncbi:MAG: energy transducer TonB [Bacteroidales bacterium]|nr:energy transducer TonB [Bacteroidales bacterium]